MLYYDVFSAEEEEAYLQLEGKRWRHEFDTHVSRLVNNDETLSEILIDFGLDEQDIFRLIEGMSHSNHLWKLTLRHWAFGDRGAIGFAQFLRQNSSLSELSLRSCGLSCEGICQILSSLGQNTNLKKLDLSHNNFRLGDPSALRTMVHSVQGLEELNLSGAKMNELCFQALFDGLKHNTSILCLDISDNLLTTETCLEIIMDYLPSLKLHKLIITHGDGTSKYVDDIPETLARLVKRLRKNSSLSFLGPLEVRKPNKRNPPTERHVTNESLTQLREVYHLLDMNGYRRDDNNTFAIDSLGVWPKILAKMNKARLPEALIFHTLVEKNDMLFSNHEQVTDGCCSNRFVHHLPNSF